MPFIHTPDHVAWKAAFAHYNWDRMADAWELIDRHGVGEASNLLGSYRLLEAEWITRRQSEIISVNDWLQFEWIPYELGDESHRLIEVAVAGCDMAAERLNWTHGAPTLIAILAAEVDRPWATNPYGYCVDKHPYEKICLPHHLIFDTTQYFEAVAHEYAHVISLNLSQAHAPRWLSEAISVLVERPIDRNAIRRFRSGSWKWREPDELEGMFNVNSDDQQGVYMAYQQAGLIGTFLASLGGEPKLARLLKELADESFWRNLTNHFKSQTRTDGALRNVYGMSEAETFAQALAFVRSSHDH